MRRVQSFGEAAGTMMELFQTGQYHGVRVWMFWSVEA